MLFKFCFGEKRIYSSLATTAWFEFGIRFIKARVHFLNAPFEKNICCQPPSHLPQLLLFLWLPALPKKKTPNSAGICLEPSFLNDAPRLGESSVTHPRWGWGGVELWEGVQLGSWTPPKILQRQGDLRTCQELKIKMLPWIFVDSISTIL